MAGGVTAKQIYDALIGAGASTNQAIGIMANWVNESSLDVETGKGGSVIDSNGYPVYGLASWNTADYPGAAGLVTGNPQQDLKSQVRFLAQTGGFQAAQGSTPAESAGNFAAKYEVCQGCQPGESQYGSRVTNASTIAGWVSSGSWPKSAGTAGAGATPPPGGGATASGSDCLFSLGGQHVGVLFGHGPTLPSTCVVSKAEARAVIGGMMLVPAGVIGIVGLALLAAAGFKASGAADKAGRLVEGIGSGVAAVPGGQAWGQGLRAGGAAVRGQGRAAASRAGSAVRTQRRARKPAQRRAPARTTAPAPAQPQPRVVGPARGRRPGEPFRYAGKPRPEPS